MVEPTRVPYATLIESSGSHLIRPVVTVGLAYNKQVLADALIDSGADASVLPYQLGLDLGANWSEARPVPRLSGNLGEAEARAIVIEVKIGSFDPARLVFIWVKSNVARLLLGQINFFQEFDVCFFGAAEYFEIFPKGQFRS